MIFHSSVLQIRERRSWKKLKFHRSVTLCCNKSGPSTYESFFHDLISQFPSVNTLEILAPALDFAYGVAVYFSRWKPSPISLVSDDIDVGECILVTSRTPFNRFVVLRCTSILFEGSELMEDVNDRLVKEDRHFVRLKSGSMQLRDEGGGMSGEKLVYQRVCVGTDHGGVISLDWPANLELSDEHGLDTTLVLIPGTADGSMEVNVRCFVRESLKRGSFPIVMNPRGCAGSPLTTPRTREHGRRSGQLDLSI